MALLNRPPPYRFEGLESFAIREVSIQYNFNGDNMGGCCTKSNPPPASKAPAKPANSAPASTAQKPAESKPAEPQTKAQPAAPSAVSVPTSYRHTGKTVYYYFDLHGRGEIIRMLLHLTDVPFEDKRLSMEEWVAKFKPTAEFGTCPILEIDGHTLVQTKAIIRYIAQTHGLYPKSFKDIYQLESFIDTVADFRENLIEYSVHNQTEKLQEHYAKMPGFLVMLEKRLNANTAKSGWVVGGQMTVADVMLFDLLWNWFLQPNRKEEHGEKVSKRLKEFADFCLERTPRIRDYVSSRQPRPF